MKQLKCSQVNPQYGQLEINIRFHGKYLFMKFSGDNPQKNQMINQLKMKGAEIIEREEWIRVNMFKNQNLVKLGNKEFDVTKISETEVENILFDFYKERYIQAHFQVEEVK